MDAKILALIATLALAASVMNISSTQNLDFTSDFENFKSTHSKVYATEQEEAYRFAIYVQNMMEVKAHNAKESSFKLGENLFADLSKEEFKASMLGFVSSDVASRDVYYSEDFNGSVDWTSKMNGVKDQGQCGSCWAFSTMGGCEGDNHIVRGNSLESYAEQQLVDCDSYSAGCNGGSMDSSFMFLESAGVCLESSYTYTARDGTCKQSSCSKSSYKPTGYTDVATGSTSSLKSKCDVQPVSIAVDADSNWQMYSSGILDTCGTSLDHGVTLVGYSSSDWKVRNSWGASWGESGYIRLAPGNTCGLANMASVPK